MNFRLIQYLTKDIFLIVIAAWFFFYFTYTTSCCGFQFFALQTLNYIAIITIVNYILVPYLYDQKRYILFAIALILLLLVGVIILEGFLEPHATLEEAFSWFAIEHELPGLANAVLGFLALKVGKYYLLQNVHQGDDGKLSFGKKQHELLNLKAQEKTSISKDYIFIKSDKSFFKINIQDILFLKAEEDFVRIHTINKKYLQAGSLKSWQNQLPPSMFQRIHKSYIVNLEKIDKVAGNRIYINNEELPIGRSFKPNLLENIESRMIKKMPET